MSVTRAFYNYGNFYTYGLTKTIQDYVIVHASRGGSYMTSQAGINTSLVLLYNLKPNGIPQDIEAYQSVQILNSTYIWNVFPEISCFVEGYTGYSGIWVSQERASGFWIFDQPVLELDLSQADQGISWIRFTLRNDITTVDVDFGIDGRAKLRHHIVQHLGGNYIGCYTSDSCCLWNQVETHKNHSER